MIKLKVLAYDERNLAHICKVEGESLTRKFDLLVGGDLNCDNPMSLIGRKFELEDEFPFISIAGKIKEIIC